MSMFQHIKNEQLQARKNKDSATALFTTLLGEFQRGKTKEDPTDAQVFSTITSMKSSIDDTIASVATGKLNVDDETLANMQKESAILNELLALKPPPAITSEQVEEAVARILEASPTAAFGQIMGQLKGVFNDKFDGAVARPVVEAILAAR